ncbi:MAG: hypothetical protein OXC26_20660 [Albidovulum sp.]|nr:hypothetical protein [Albidovulum sp.]
MFFNIVAAFAEFKADLIRMRTREGMAISRSKAVSRASSRCSRVARKKSSAGCTPAATAPYLVSKFGVKRGTRLF